MALEVALCDDGDVTVDDVDVTVDEGDVTVDDLAPMTGRPRPSEDQMLGETLCV